MVAEPCGARISEEHVSDLAKRRRTQQHDVGLGLDTLPVISGVSMVAADRPLATAPRPEDVERSETCRTLGVS
ncbi:MAG: hypothetical protein JRG95_17005 [Deltaproteobacteria bacterium]|nr:hypothetical protein [Deltaproteobacteria bacterium]